MKRALVLMTAVALATGACGGNSPTTPGPPPQPPPPRVTFAADSSNPGVQSIALALSGSTLDTLTLVLRAESVTDLYGYGLDIVFDPAIIAFDEATPGTFFDESGVSVTTQVVEATPGTLVIGQTRVGDVDAVSGGGTLLTLEFTAVAPGSTSFDIENAGAFDSAGDAVTIGFFGGSATVPGTAR